VRVATRRQAEETFGGPNRYHGLTDDGKQLATWPETEADGFTYSGDKIKQAGTPKGPTPASSGERNQTSLHKLARAAGIDV
jgi:hypothetical protein